MSFTDFHRLPPSVLQNVVNSDVPEKRDEITAVVYRASKLVLGTRCGNVWFLCEGEVLPKLLGTHGSRILEVAIDLSGAFAASSAEDGSLTVRPLLCDIGGEDAKLRSLRWSFSYSRPVYSIAFNPKYASKVGGSRSLCIGGEDGKLIINKRGAFESKNVILHHGEGPITRISWRGTLIAWANSKGVKIVDVVTYQKVTHLAWPRECQSDSEAMRCCIHWQSDDVLLIGWNSYVIVAEVRQKACGPSGVRFANVAHCFRFDTCTVSGVLPFDSSHVAILTTSNSKDETGVASIAYHVCARDGRVLSSECLLQQTSHQPFHLVSGDEARVSYIIGAQDIIAVERRSISNHITSLVTQGDYETAISLASQSGSLHDAEQKRRMCMLCVAPLLAHGEPDRAAKLVQRIDIWDTESWSQCIQVFEQAGALRQLLPFIPIPPHGVSLSCEVYDAVLGSLAADSSEAVLNALERWPAGIYSAAPLKKCLHDMLHDDLTESRVTNAREHRSLVEALASLHQAQGDLSSAADLFFQLGSSSLFPFLARHLEDDEDLRRNMSQRVSQLFDLNPAEAVEIFVNHSTTFPGLDVISKLAPLGTWWQYRYLTFLRQKQPDVARSHCGLHLKFVAELEPHNLRSLLEEIIRGEEQSTETSTGNDSDLPFSIPEVLDVARGCGAIDAEVVLLMWERKVREAVELSLKKLGDVWIALCFVDRASPDVMAQAWQDVVDFAASDCQAYASLHVYLDAMDHTFELPNATRAALVQHRPLGLEVPGLALHITNAINDAEAGHDVQKAALDVLQKQTSTLGSKLFLTQRRGTAVVPAGWARSGKPRQSTRSNEGLPWHKIRAPKFRLDMVLRAAVDNL